MSQKFRVAKLRSQKSEDLLKELDKLKQELSTLRTAKISSGNNQKVSRIRTVRKRIAKYLTVINEQVRSKARTDAKKGKLPVDLRGKRTRAIRHRLTKSQRAQKTERQWKRETNFPLRKFALKA